jgi:AsmA protein
VDFHFVTRAGLKRLAIAAISLGALGAGALIAVSRLIPAESVRGAVMQEIRGMTGLEPVIRGETSVSLFPSGTVKFTDVALGDANAPALTSEQLTAHLRLLPLLLGRIETADVSLSHPAISFAVEPDGSSNWSGLFEPLARMLDPNASRTERMTSFSEIRISAGTINLRNDARGINETISDADLSLAWPSISRSFAATGHFTWRGEQVDATVSLTDLFRALVGERSGVKLRASANPFKLAFDGHMSYRPTLKVEGVLSADSSSPREVFELFGHAAPPGNGFERFSLKARTNIVGGTIALSSVNLELDHNAAEGVLAIGLDERTTLQGTLAADTIDLSPYLSAARMLRASEHEWSRAPFLLDGMVGLDIDLRLSAAQVKLANATLSRTAIATNLRNNRMTITIGESQAFGGVLKGSVAINKKDAGAEIRSLLQFNDVDLESCLGELFGVRRLEGKGNMSVNVEAVGESVFALTQSMNGSISLTAKSGALAGINVEQLLRRLEKRPLSGGGDFRSGRTPYDELMVALKIAQGKLTVDDVSFVGPTVKLALSGSASIPTRDLDLKGTAGLVTASTNSASAFELPFVVQGPWDDPLMLPDVQILIRRSGAAAPLLEAIKDRKAREAVRSAIEQLTNRSGSAATSSPPNASDPATPASGADAPR